MDNFYKERCPPVMHDGRHLTDHTPTKIKDMQIAALKGFKRDSDQRLYYQTKGAEIMDEQWKFLKETSSCTTSQCVHTFPSTRIAPGMLADELKAHNLVYGPQGTLVAGKGCASKDYRMTDTS